MERAQFFAIAALALRDAFARPGYDDGQHANEQAFCALTESGCLSCFGTASYGGEVPGDAHMVAATSAEGFEDLRHEVEIRTLGDCEEACIAEAYCHAVSFGGDTFACGSWHQGQCEGAVTHDNLQMSQNSESTCLGACRAATGNAGCCHYNSAGNGECSWHEGATSTYTDAKTTGTDQAAVCSRDKCYLETDTVTSPEGLPGAASTTTYLKNDNCDLVTGSCHCDYSAIYSARKGFLVLREDGTAHAWGDMMFDSNPPGCSIKQADRRRRKRATARARRPKGARRSRSSRRRRRRRPSRSAGSRRRGTTGAPSTRWGPSPAWCGGSDS